MYRYIVFDVDGTLIETEQAVVDSYQRVIHEEFGKYFTMEEIFKNHSVPTYERMKRFRIRFMSDSIISTYYKLKMLYEALKARIFRNLRL